MREWRDHIGTKTQTQADLDAWLLEAVLDKKTDEITAALDAGADPDARYEGHPNKPHALHLAVQQGSPAQALMLIRAGATLDQQNDAGQTPLHNAVTYGCTVPAQTLLAHGADPHITDKSGNTALHMAVANHSDPASIAAVLLAGGQVQATNSDGKNVIQFAKRMGAGNLDALQEEIDWLGSALRPASLPDGDIDRVALFDEDRRKWQLTPQNIGFWQQFDSIATKLAAQGEPITRDDFIWPRDKDGQLPDHLFEQAWAFFRLPQALKTLAVQGTYLSAQDLAYDNGEPRHYVQEMAKCGALHQLFDVENWRGAKPQQVHECYHALHKLMPEQTEDQVRNSHQLLATLRMEERNRQRSL